MPNGELPEELKEKLSPQKQAIASWFLSFSERFTRTDPIHRKQYAEWESQAIKHWSMLNYHNRQAADAYQRLSGEVPEKYVPPAVVGKIPIYPGLNMGELGEKQWLREAEEIRTELANLVDVIEKDEFYYKLYSEVPVAISSGIVNSPDEILAYLKPPKAATKTELESIKNIISGMIAAISRVAPEEVTPEMTPGEAEELGLPTLIPPVGIAPKPIGISVITTEEILKAITAPSIPPQVMSDEEWYELLKMEGYSDADLEEVAYTKGLADELIAGWVESSNQLEEFRANVAELPSYSAVDYLKDLATQPGLTVLGAAQYYFEHVSMPLAGLVYKTFIPDIEAEYQRLRKTESTWMALSYAWEGWEFNWFVKYMLMETLIDPLTYVGWGIATRVTKPIPYVGRFVGAAEKGVQALFEIPFDLVKAGWKKIPSTMGQRALSTQRVTGRLVDRAFTKHLGKPLHKITMKEMDEAADIFVKHVLANPQSEDWMALAGREILRHAPIDDKLLRSWSKRLGTTLTPEDITRVTLENAENLFEDYFMKGIITQKEAAGRLMRILSTTLDDDTLKLTQRLLQERANTIMKGAMLFTKAKTPFRAMQFLMRKNYRTHVALEESAAALVRKEVGGHTVLLHNIDVRLQSIWRSGVDKFVVRPFAEAYLTFGMYGPMNVLEDYLRSSLGGVFPKRMTTDEFRIVATGLAYDPDITRAGISEMLGYLAREGAEEGWNNWILQMATLGKRGWADKVYTGLVRIPGAYGMDVRRNFLARRYLQILSERGGDVYQTLMKTGPKTPRLADKNLVRNLETAVHHAKSSGNPDFVRNVKGQFTHKKVVRNEVNTILKEHPELPNAIRDFVRKEFDGDMLFAEGGISIDRTIGESNTMLLDEFIRGSELATEQMKSLADVLTQMEVRNPQEMAWCIQQLHVMSNVYGATPRQIIGQTTVRSRGLPFAERRAQFDVASDNMYMFLDRAGADVDRVITRLKAVMREPGVAMSDDYITQADRLFDIMTTKRELGAEFRAQNMASRHDIFARATKADMKSKSFWDDFYVHMDNEYAVFNQKMADLDGILTQAAEGVDLAAGVKPFPRPAIKVIDRPLAPQDVAKLLGCRGDDISRSLLDVLTVQNDREMFITYVLAKTRPGDTGFTKESIGVVYDQIVHSLQTDPRTLSWITAKQMELEAVRRDLHYLHNSKVFPKEEKVIIDRFLDETAGAMDDLMYITKPPRKGQPPTKVLKEEYTGLNDLRQGAMDEAHKWYYKEYPDYTNANAFDAMMKSIYPYWTYESQRWFWLPRSFVRHPGTFTAFERWQDNTDYGYIHIPGTSVDINPFRGTIYGTLTTRLTRRDYPEYYDSLPFAGNFVEFNDFLSRWGFYPGAHVGIPLAMFGGLEQQMGETMPAIWKTPLNAAVALFPENEGVRFISDTIFSDRFRDYMTILMVNKRGGDGTFIWTKMEEGLDITEEEQTMWTSARREAAAYGVGFEQFGLFRLRSDEQYRIYEESSKVIEEMTGFTPDQQDWLRKHGYKIWDLVGGMSPTHQAILQELDAYSWMGSIRPLLPSKQQVILNRLELDWDDVRRYTEDQQQERLRIQQEFLTGMIGARDYNDQLIDLYDDQRSYIDRKVSENPMMTLEGRTGYYEEFNVPMPVLHPMRELLNLYFDIELKDKIDEETGEKVKDWDTFWAQREAVEGAIPPHLKQEWNDYISRNSTRMEMIRGQVYKEYFRPYNKVWEAVLTSYPEDEQKLIKEFLYLERMDKDFARQEVISGMVSVKTGNMLVSSFRSDVSNARLALRYANPTLDAWLRFWGRVESFQTPQAEVIFVEICKDVGRGI